MNIEPLSNLIQIKIEQATAGVLKNVKDSAVEYGEVIAKNRGSAVQLHETGNHLKLDTLLSWLRGPQYRDDGQPLFNFGFVRKVTQEEGHEIATYPAKLVSRMAMIDSAIDEIPDAVKRDRQARSVAASAEAEVRAAQAAKFKEREDNDAAEIARLNGQNTPVSKPN